MKFISWNIDSLNAALTSDSRRAVMSRAVLDTLKEEAPDVIGLQETKLPAKGPAKKHLKLLHEHFPNYNLHFRSAEPPARKSYAGTMFMVRKGLDYEVTKPSLAAPEPMDQEGRLLTLEFPDFYLTQVYTPNAGGELKRLPQRQEWDARYRDYLVSLDQHKPLFACGDFNVAHEEIDLANPKSNRGNAGFTDEERAGFTNLLNAGFTDTFRHLHGPVEGQYTWWNQRAKTSKLNNSGWRIDYWLTSNRIADEVEASRMVDSGERQDHTPIALEFTL